MDKSRNLQVKEDEKADRITSAIANDQLQRQTIQRY